MSNVTELHTKKTLDLKPYLDPEVEKVIYSGGLMRTLMIVAGGLFDYQVEIDDDYILARNRAMKSLQMCAKFVNHVTLQDSLHLISDLITVKVETLTGDEVKLTLSYKGASDQPIVKVTIANSFREVGVGINNEPKLLTLSEIEDLDQTLAKVSNTFSPTLLDLLTNADKGVNILLSEVGETSEGYVGFTVSNILIASRITTEVTVEFLQDQ